MLIGYLLLSQPGRGHWSFLIPKRKHLTCLNVLIFLVLTIISVDSVWTGQVVYKTPIGQGGCKTVSFARGGQSFNI